jgi:hypothetical protein
MKERFMKKITLAVFIAVFMVPMLFWSRESSALPAFARKYQTSCYTCHSGFPTRNAFGEAFRNNGYRWPGGEEEEHVKQEQTMMGSEGWKKSFPQSPWPTDIPGFAPFSVWVRGNLLNYSQEVQDKNGNVKTKEVFNYGNGPLNATTLFFSGTMGENLSAFGAYNPTNGSASGHVVWSFAPGINLSFGNAFSDFNFGNQSTIYTTTFPVPGNSVEFSYIKGETGGIKLTAGLAQTGTAAANHFDDLRYVRAKYKIGGAGLLSGAGGTFGNEYIGLDNQLSVGASLVSARDGALTTGNYAGETMSYGVDVTGNYGNFTGGVAFSRANELDFDNYVIDGGYYVFPWLKATVRYTSIRDGENPTLAAGITTFLRANASVAATYTHLTKETTTTGDTTPDTFTLQAAFAF